METLATFAKQHGFSPQRARKLASEQRIGAWIPSDNLAGTEFLPAQKIGPRAWVVPNGSVILPPNKPSLVCGHESPLIVRGL